MLFLIVLADVQPADTNQIYFLENLFNLYIEGHTDFFK